VAVTSMANSSLRNFQKSNLVSGPRPQVTVDFLVLAGGGAGGTGGSGLSGGGAGGYRTSVGTSGGGATAENSITLPAGTHPVLIGAGGTGGQPGLPSYFASISCVGGGPGVWVMSSRVNSRNGVGGGSGSGGSRWDSGGSGGPGIQNQGFRGGNPSGSGPRGAGGGGAGGAGSMSPGAGLTSSITGTAVLRARGGGSGATSANSGQGGNGGSSGGSGVVIFLVPTGNTAKVTFSAGVTHSMAVVGSNRVYIVTATSTTSETVTIS